MAIKDYEILDNMEKYNLTGEIGRRNNLINNQTMTEVTTVMEDGTKK